MKNIFTSASVCFINIPYQTEPVIEKISRYLIMVIHPSGKDKCNHISIKFVSIIQSFRYHQRSKVNLEAKFYLKVRNC